MICNFFNKVRFLTNKLKLLIFMKKPFLHLHLSLLFLMGCVFLLPSCIEDKAEDAAHRLVVSKVDVELIQTGMLNTGSKASFDVLANRGYVITSDAEWLDVDKPTGKGRVSVTLEAKPNETAGERTGHLTVTSGKLSERVTVTQTLDPDPDDGNPVGYTYYSENFDWIAVYGGADCVGLGSQNGAKNIYSTGDALQKFGEAGLQDYNPVGKTMYACAGYFKMGATDKQTGIILPALKIGRKKASNVELTFETCPNIGGLYGVYELDDTWYGPHTFDNDSSHEAIWNVPSENSKVEWSWYFKYFYHNSSYVYFDIETAGYNGFILTPSLNPQGSYYTQWKLGSPYRKFNDKDLRKKPYRYLGNKRYEGMFLVGKQVNFDDPTKVCLGQKEYSGKVIDMVDQVARFSEVGSKYGSVAELTSTMADGEENSGIRLVKSPQPNLADKQLRWNPDCPVIRLSEIYYMLAECELRAGHKKEAAELINQVRARNFENRNDPDPVTADNLDEYRMLDEWMIEFLGEGRRRTDLIRWGAFTSESWWDHTPSNDKNMNRFPIPNSAISANNLIKQNPGYGGTAEE